MDTSRVVQAYATVQLFVERCLMNLETNVAIDASQDDAWSEWDWMKRYRLWQANREIFLWPENWLVEADRPNSSEIFDPLVQGPARPTAPRTRLRPSSSTTSRALTRSRICACAGCARTRSPPPPT